MKTTTRTALRYRVTWTDLDTHAEIFDAPADADGFAALVNANGGRATVALVVGGKEAR